MSIFTFSRWLFLFSQLLFVSRIAFTQPLNAGFPWPLPPSNDGLLVQPDAPGNLYVVLAGNGTCSRWGTSASVAGLKNVVLFESFNRWFLNTGLVTSKDNVIFACYEWLSPEMQFFVLRGSSVMAPVHESQLDVVVTHWASVAQRVIIIGHSYAGWRAMKLAALPQLNSLGSEPKLVATIDPVSRVTCQRLREDGCRKPPSDLTHAELYHLNTQTRWLNLFHEPAVILGSGPIPAAHFNVRAMGNHVSMEGDDFVWSNIRQFVVDNLNAMSSGR
jgi:hypothetical protein